MVTLMYQPHAISNTNLNMPSHPHPTHPTYPANEKAVFPILIASGKQPKSKKQTHPKLKDGMGTIHSHPSPQREKTIAEISFSSEKRKFEWFNSHIPRHIVLGDHLGRIGRLVFEKA